MTPSKITVLHELFWDGKICQKLPSLEDIRQYIRDQIQEMREDHKRFLNPTPYKVSVTSELYETLQNLWQQEAPIPELTK